MEFAQIIKKKRAEKFKTAKDFYKEKSISCAYAYYVKIEKGHVPEIKIALELIDKLQVNLKAALNAWVRDQMPTSGTKALFHDHPDNTQPYTGVSPRIDEALLVNRMQAKLLEQDPIYWELLMFLVSFRDVQEKGCTINDLVKGFDKSETHYLQEKLNDLYEYGLVDIAHDRRFRAKKMVVVPYEQEFQRLRDKNFVRAFEQFKAINTENKFRTTITRLLEPEDIKIVEAKVIALTNSIIEIATPQTNRARPYTIGVFASPRKFGP